MSAPAKLPRWAELGVLPLINLGVALVLTDPLEVSLTLSVPLALIELLTDATPDVLTVTHAVIECEALELLQVGGRGEGRDVGCRCDCGGCHCGCGCGGGGGCECC